MVKICEVCGLKQTPGCGKTFHNIPCDVIVAESWCKALKINRSNLKRKFPVICSSHFLPHQVIGVGLRTILVRNAIPTCEVNVGNEDAPSTSRQVYDHETHEARSFELEEVKHNIEDIDVKDHSFLTTQSASSSPTPLKMLKTEEGAPKVFEDIDAGELSSSTTITASENEDVETTDTPEYFSISSANVTLSQGILKTEDETPKVFEDIDAGEQSSSTTITASENEDVETTDTPEYFSISSANVTSSQGISSPRRTNACNYESNFRKKSIRYFGDFESDDMEDAEKRRRFIQIVQKSMSRKTAKIRQLQQKNRRMKRKIETLKLLVQHLRNGNI